MSQHVGQYLLQDTKNRRRLFAIQFDLIAGVGPVTLESGASLKLFYLPFNRGDEPEIIQHSRTQFRSDSSYGGDDCFNRGRHRANALVQRTIGGGSQQRVDSFKVPLQTSQRTAEFIVNLTRDARPFFFTSGT